MTEEVHKHCTTLVQDNGNLKYDTKSNIWSDSVGKKSVNLSDLIETHRILNGDYNTNTDLFFKLMKMV